MKNRINFSVSILRFAIYLFSIISILLSSSPLPAIGCEDGDVACKKNKLAEVLFNLAEGSADSDTNHDYNDYGDNPNKTFNGIRYIGGHAGWDIQTKSVEGRKTADEDFHSLTAGRVIRADEGTFNQSSVIAVYNETDEKTVLYLHAREVYVYFGQPIIVGSPLGIQGNTGLGKEEGDINTAEHVHIEVQAGWSINPSGGTDDTGDENRKIYKVIDPIPYLYESVQSSAVPEEPPRNDNILDLTWNFIVNFFRKTDRNEGGGVPVPEDEVDTIDEGHILAGNVLVSHLNPLFISMIPQKTGPLPNYPNPFNPETWIPYQLAKPTEVTLTISTVDGKVVKTFEVGHQPAGFYQDRSRAIYWDGRNEFGERVISGIYFYTLSAGEFTATRKMLILK